jgi:hypothetical protein
MKTLLRLAIGAAATAAFVNMVRTMKSRDGRSSSRSFARDESQTNAVSDTPDTNTIHDGNADDAQRGPQPQDWRGAQNVLE